MTEPRRKRPNRIRVRAPKGVDLRGKAFLHQAKAGAMLAEMMRPKGPSSGTQISNEGARGAGVPISNEGPSRTSPTPGMKFDDGKLAYQLIDEAAEAELVAVLTFGAVKYDAWNWVGLEDAQDRFYGAARRHLRAARAGEVVDHEHGLLSLAGALCSVHFLLALELRKHPELAASLPERLAKAVAIAKDMRTKRKAAADKPITTGLGWPWKTRSAKGRTLAYGIEPTREAAKEAGVAALGKRKGKVEVG